jgi:hypothetical protein
MTLDFKYARSVQCHDDRLRQRVYQTFDSYASDDRKKIKTSAAPNNLLLSIPTARNFPRPGAKFHSVVAKILFATRGKTRYWHLDLVPLQEVRESDAVIVKLEHLIDYLRGPRIYH